jgi:hypothetical protein
VSSEEQPQAPGPEVPDDANDLRGFYFRQLIRKPLTLILVGGFALIVGIALGALIGPAVGGAAFVVALLVGVVVVFMLADSRAADAFFEVYCQKHGYVLGGRTSLPAATPLLRKGDDRYADRTMTGELAPGVSGILALYTYEDETTDSEGNRQTNYYHYTIGLIQIPECVEQVPELFCQRKFGLRALEGLEDVFRRSKERVKLESEELDKKYEIFAGKGQDEVWLRRLFSPTFIVWLTDAAPKKFAFELVDGTLCCYVNGHKDNAEDLDVVAAATGAVAKRLQDESSETNLER